MVERRNHESVSQITMEVAAPVRGESWVVEVQDRDGVRSMPVPPSGLVVGASRTACLRVADPTVSGTHCEIHRLGAGLVVRDRGSKNGTYAGGARVTEAWGGAGTTVTIGHTTVTFASSEGPRVEDDDAPPLPGIAGGSREMRRVAGQVRRLARHSAPVLVSGETGCGKELVARALHAEGPRRGRPFVVVNVAALPRELVESELFGHERGAFTGAVARHRGAFASAEGGSLFLDEIGELPVDAQPKLLRALDGYEVRSVGDQGSGKVADVRVVAATHAPLEERVMMGAFR
ncbi:MAG: sigma-54-dependent Fis family transcriptional regulator, partial [Myxococcales bacterium]|nr:sigma-54-dependent Fis family transcriptional regulator [Myxococcales bacterium]